jgi:Mg2+/Co2+ transporter CorB
MAVSRLQAETLARQNIPGAKTLLKLKEKPRQFIITILIGNNLVNTAASALATVLAMQYFGSSGVGIATGVMTFVLLTFGEIIPKTYATIHAKKISLFMARISLIFIYLFYPLVIIFEKLTSLFLKMFSASNITPLFSESELRTLVEMGVKENQLNITEKEFIEGVLEFKEIRTAEIMTPKRRLFSLEEKMTVEDAIHEINKREHSRIPVYDDVKENITGIVHLKDILAVSAEQRQTVRLKEIAKQPLFVEEYKLISGLFKQMQGRHVHMAIVVNKKRELKGIVTLEDIIEQIVGDIFDEKDISPTLMKRVKKTMLLVHTGTEIDDINKFFNITLPIAEKHQVLLDFLETLKKKEWQEGMRLRFNDLVFVIKDVEEKKPIKVFIEKK